MLSLTWGWGSSAFHTGAGGGGGPRRYQLASHPRWDNASGWPGSGLRHRRSEQAAAWRHPSQALAYLSAAGSSKLNQMDKLGAASSEAGGPTLPPAAPQAMAPFRSGDLCAPIYGLPFSPLRTLPSDSVSSALACCRPGPGSPGPRDAGGLCLALAQQQCQWPRQPWCPGSFVSDCAFPGSEPCQYSLMPNSEGGSLFIGPWGRWMMWWVADRRKPCPGKLPLTSE